jgi:hypothetical protein
MAAVDWAADRRSRSRSRSSKLEHRRTCLEMRSSSYSNLFDFMDEQTAVTRGRS